MTGGRRAVLFPGQGTQRPGMGERFWHLSAAARDVYALAGEVLGRDVAGLCFRGSPEALRDTANAQIAVVVTDLAALALAREHGFEPDVVAGHSVGELAAVAAVGSLGTATVLRTVARRAELMAALPATGGMAAISGLDDKQLDALCDETRRRGPVGVAVHNADRNAVISGDLEALAEVTAAARTAGGKVTPLVVSHAFHSPLMEPMVDAWRGHVESLDLAEPRIPLIANTTGAPLRTAAGIAAELVSQVTATVEWRATMTTLGSLSVATVVEAGDTRVLTGFGRGAQPPVSVLPLADPRTLRVLAADAEVPA